MTGTTAGWINRQIAPEPSQHILGSVIGYGAKQADVALVIGTELAAGEYPFIIRGKNGGGASILLPKSSIIELRDLLDAHLKSIEITEQETP